MIQLVRPTYQQLSFRKQLLSDKPTMAFNQNWGGVIEFPESRWKSWYEKWLCSTDDNYFYRYIYSEEEQAFIGETSYHRDAETFIYLCDIIIEAQFRGKGYGKETLKMLCENAAKNGIYELYDNISLDNPSVKLFLKTGFTEEYKTDEYVMLKKHLDYE